LNRFRYIRQISYSQLRGNIKDEISKCEPIEWMEDVWQYHPEAKSIGGNSFEASDIANPCGSPATLYFNDYFEIRVDETQEDIPILSDDITWSVNKKNKFKNNEDWLNTQWLDVENGKIQCKDFVDSLSRAFHELDELPDPFFLEEALGPYRPGPGPRQLHPLHLEW
jgi:LEM3 (ligand-effect modulator 3) family / CDC50 family